MWTNHDSSDSGAKTRSGRRYAAFKKCQACILFVSFAMFTWTFLHPRMHRTDKQFINFRNRSCSLETIIKQIWTRTKDTMRPWLTRPNNLKVLEFTSVHTQCKSLAKGYHLQAHGERRDLWNLGTIMNYPHPAAAVTAWSVYSEWQQGASTQINSFCSIQR